MFCCTSRRSPRVPAAKSWGSSGPDGFHDGSRRGSNSVDGEDDDAGQDSSFSRPFDPQLVNKACREIEIPSQDGDEFGRRSGLADVCEEDKPWWHTQLQTQLSHAKIEGLERMRRRRLALNLAEEEQQRRVSEETRVVMLDVEERKRRREFAKRTLTEERHTRIREQEHAASRDLAERDRRRRWAVKALVEEERSRVEERLMQRERGLSTGIPEEARRRHALFLAGVRFWVQHYRAAGAPQNEGKGVVRHLKDLYTRECLKMTPPQATVTMQSSAQREGTGGDRRGGAGGGEEARELLLQARRDRMDTILAREPPAPVGESRSLSEVVEERRKALETYSTRSPTKGSSRKFGLGVRDSASARGDLGEASAPSFRPMPATAFASPPPSNMDEFGARRSERMVT